MKIAIVCDFLTKFGGAQKVLLAIHEIYPDAPIFCLLYDEEGTKGKFKDCKIIPSKLQKLPRLLRQKPKFLIGSLASAVENFDFSSYDVVISSNDSYAHGVITKPDTFHLSYCHTPMRYAWDWHNEYLIENNIGFGLKGLFVRYVLHKLRIWDRVSADRVDHWIANSQNVKKRIAKYYLNDADVVYPPVETDDIMISDELPEDFYVVASRLEPYKRINLAIEACNKLKKRLIIIGEGSEKQKLTEMAGDTIEFVGWKYGQELFDYLGRAKAFIFPGEDDFGIAPVEAMAAGRPVIAFGKGGTLESIIDGKTGLFFYYESVQSLSDTIIKLEKNYSDFSPKSCREQAMKFSKTQFKKKMSEHVEQGYIKHKEMMENA
jgi:glycosyltransferase involved in cell wall biosynthesis